MAPALMAFWIGLLWLDYIYKIRFVAGTLAACVILAVGTSISSPPTEWKPFCCTRLNTRKLTSGVRLSG